MVLHSVQVQHIDQDDATNWASQSEENKTEICSGAGFNRMDGIHKSCLLTELNKSITLNCTAGDGYAIGLFLWRVVKKS